MVNQVGCLPQWQKTAFFLNNQKPTAHPQLIDRNTQELIATLFLSTEVKDSDTQDAIATIDFSSVTKPGTYYLKRGKLQSAPFRIATDRIATDIYEQPLVTLLRSY